MAAKKSNDDGPITIKKYANRRLYNTATSSYVTLDHLCQMVKDGQDFVVYDAKSGDDITRSVLTQIIFEEESKGQNLLPIRFLRQLIGFYGDSLESLVPGYLEVSMESFTRNQEEMRKHMGGAFGEMFPFGQFEELSRRNVAMFQRAMNMFGADAGGAGANEEANEDTPEAAGEATDEVKDREPAGDEIGELRDKLAEMERQIDALANKKE